MLGFGRKQRQPRKFNYIPRSYDPAKKEVEERIRSVREARDGNYSLDGASSRIRGAIRKNRSTGKGNNMQRRIRIIIILVMVTLMIFLSATVFKIAPMLNGDTEEVPSQELYELE